MAGKWLIRLVTLALSALASLSATWWSLKFAGVSSPSGNVATFAAPAPGSNPADLAKVFGPPVARATSAAVAIAPGPVNPATRFALLGVVSDKARTGVALISVDGKAARPYRVGTRIEDSFTLKSVAVRSAVLSPSSPDGADFTVELVAVGSVPQVSPVPPLTGMPPAAVQSPPASQTPPTPILPGLPGAPPLLRPAR